MTGNEQRMNQVETKKLSSMLLTNLQLTTSIYVLVKRAAKSVYDDPRMTKRNQTCAYPNGTLATNRQHVRAITTRYQMEYHPDDIVVVGGMAMAMYDTLKQYNSAYGIQSLPYMSYTSDIDMVWYPRIVDNEPSIPYDVLTIRSPAMEEHVLRLEEEMKQAIQDNLFVMNMTYIIKNTIPYVETVELTVGKSDAGLLAGAHKILIFCTLTYIDHTTIMFELCDISIHDGGSSQITRNEDGSPILVPMYYDPMYCSPLYQLIMIHTPLHIGITVPNMVSMIKQQLLAFHNLLHKSSDKCIMYYKRIRYLQMIIVRNSHLPQIIQSFGIPNQNIEMLQTMIDDAIQSIIIAKCTYHEELCKTLLDLEQNRHVPFKKLFKKPSAESAKNSYIPSIITYRIRRNQFITIHLNDELKSSIEQMDLGTYYHILSMIQYDSEDYKKANEQLNRLKRIIHDIHDKIHANIEKRIIAESKLEPLQSLLQKEAVI
jgi:hypothetical protein